MTYSLDFRHKVLSVRLAEGLSIAQVAVRFDVGAASVVRWIKRPEPQRNRIKPFTRQAVHAPSRSRAKPFTRIDMIALAADVRLFPDAYHEARAVRLGVSKSGIGSALRRMGYSFKKTLRHPKADHSISKSDGTSDA